MLNKKNIGMDLFHIRLTHGLSLLNMASRCAMSDTDIENIEKGIKPISSSEFLQIAKALQCDACDLLLILGEDNRH